ncbi:MAG TPA: hypothetical protein VIV15_00995 [Anaerolineales bacterium]
MFGKRATLSAKAEHDTEIMTEELQRFLFSDSAPLSPDYLMRRCFVLSNVLGFLVAQLAVLQEALGKQPQFGDIADVVDRKSLAQVTRDNLLKIMDTAIETGLTVSIGDR